MTYKHFTIEERETIQLMLWKKKSVRSIAKALNRNPSSVSREINKNRDSLNRRHYIPRTAHVRAVENKSKRGREKKLKNDILRNHVVKHLKLGWSPEQIANTVQERIGESISHEAIYQYVYSQIHRNGYGYPKPNCEDLRPYLARHKKRRTKKGMRKSYRIEKGPLPSIDDRPIEVKLRINIGHWEDDLIVSRQSKPKLKTINELFSGVVLIKKINDGTVEETNRAVIERLGKIPEEFRKTLTMDRGSENLGYQEIENTLGLDCFYAHAYSSWERGANENLNGLIRRFLPKKTNFNDISDDEINKIEYLLNSRPRKRLGWKTPYEVFYEKTGVALEY